MKNTIQRHEVPLNEELVRQLCRIWQDMFPIDFSPMERVLGGRERDTNLDIVYVVKDGSQIVATTHLTVSRSDPRIGGLGEVATVATHRGRGLAGALCGRAAEEFDAAGGERLFLGTANPAAARIYQRLGWRYLPNTNVMLRAGSVSFIDNYYRTGAGLSVEITAGHSGQRVTMIPLIVADHECTVLDSNTELYTVKAQQQKSCMSLYPRYESLEQEGTRFAATRQDGAVVGLSSAKRLDAQTIQVDVFSHGQAEATVSADLLHQAVDWATSQPGAIAQAVCTPAEFRKHKLLMEMNLRPTGRRCPLAGCDGQFEGEIYTAAD